MIGDLKGIRARAKFSKKGNQKIHQWAFSRIAEKICYKAELVGTRVISASEAYTSQTGPKCGNLKKPATETITAHIAVSSIIATTLVLSTFSTKYQD